MEIRDVKTIKTSREYEVNDVFYGVFPELYIVVGFAEGEATIKRMC